MKTIPVSGASGIVGYGILRTLQRTGKPLTLIGTTIYDDSVAPGFCDIFELAPPTADAAYMGWLLKTIANYQVDLIIPGIEIDMYKWVDHVPEIERSGAIALLNEVELIHLCKDKWAFYENLRVARHALCDRKFVEHGIRFSYRTIRAAVPSQAAPWIWFKGHREGRL